MPSVAEAIKNMFGFIVEQPIHKTLRDMRVVHVCLLASSQWTLLRIVDAMQTLDPAQAAMAYGAIAAALITAIWKGLDGLHKSNERDL